MLLKCFRKCLKAKINLYGGDACNNDLPSTCQPRKHKRKAENSGQGIRFFVQCNRISEADAAAVTAAKSIGKLPVC